MPLVWSASSTYHHSGGAAASHSPFTYGVSVDVSWQVAALGITAQEAWVSGPHTWTKYW